MHLSPASEHNEGTSEAKRLHDGSLLPEDPFTPLEHLVHLLQGSLEFTIADVGITTLPFSYLDSIASNARQQADLCNEHSDVMLELLQCCLENGPTPEPGTLLGMTRQLRRVGRDQRRWYELADNAAYYRDNIQVATRIAAGVARKDLKPKQPAGSSLPPATEGVA